MKRTILTLLVILLTSLVFAQELQFNGRGIRETRKSFENNEWSEWSEWKDIHPFPVIIDLNKAFIKLYRSETQVLNLYDTAVGEKWDENNEFCILFVSKAIDSYGDECSITCSKFSLNTNLMVTIIYENDFGISFICEK